VRHKQNNWQDLLVVPKRGNYLVSESKKGPMNSQRRVIVPPINETRVLEPLHEKVDARPDFCAHPGHSTLATEQSLDLGHTTASPLNRGCHQDEKIRSGAV
jgi:hypothetical protein